MATDRAKIDEDACTQQLLVEVDVEIPDSSPCPLCDLSDSVVEVRRQLAVPDCHLEAERLDGDCDCARDCTQVEHVATEIEPSCPCPVFVEHDCLPEVVGVDGTTVRLQAHLTDRERLSTLIADLRAATEHVSVRRLKQLVDDRGEKREKFVTIDLYELTEKQRQTITAAVSAGYYATPRETSLGELADRLEISKSALSQRLKAAESKLVNAAFSRSRPSY